MAAPDRCGRFYISLRPYEDTAELTSTCHGLAQAPQLRQLHRAWQQSDFLHFFINSAIITIPAVMITLFLASLIAFAVSRYSLQVQPDPAARVHRRQPAAAADHPGAALPHLPRCCRCRTCLNDKGVWYDSYWGVAAIHIAFQTGFATFVLSNFMKALPTELTEAALVDGADVWTQYRQDHPAAVPSGARRARRAHDHVDLQRLPVGASS